MPEHQGYPAKKYIPGLGTLVFIQEDELSKELQDKIAKLEERIAELEANVGA